MKVLLPIIWHETTHCIARAFEQEGHTVKVVDWRRKSKHQTADEMVIAAARSFRPDFAFCQFQAPGVITSKMPRTLADMGCFAVNWAGDVRHPLPEWYLDMAPHFAVTSFSNMTDVELVREAGYRSEFLQIGYDEHLYNTGFSAGSMTPEGFVQTQATERSGVVFIGNNSGGYKFAESDGRRQLVDAMAEAFKDQFSVYGMSWERYGGKYIAEPHDANVLRRSLIALNWDHFHRPWFASDRLLRGTACGCAMVSQWYEGISEEHPHVVGVLAIQEAVDAVKLLLDRPDVARQLGAANAANTILQHRWNNRVDQMMKWK